MWVGAAVQPGQVRWLAQAGLLQRGLELGGRQRKPMADLAGGAVAAVFFGLCGVGRAGLFMRVMLMPLVAFVLDRRRENGLLFGDAVLTRHGIANPAAQRQQGDHQGQQEQAHGNRNDKPRPEKFLWPAFSSARFDVHQDFTPNPVDTRQCGLTPRHVPLSLRVKKKWRAPCARRVQRPSRGAKLTQEN